MDGGALKLVGVGGSKIGGPVVEGPEAGGEEVTADVDGEEPGSDGGVDDLANDAINLHGFETFVGVIGSKGGLFVGAFDGELIEVGVAAASLGRTTHGADKDVITDDPVIDVAVLHDPRGLVTETGVCAGLPELGGFYYVGICGDELFKGHGLAFLSTNASGYALGGYYHTGALE